jgi:hypothetical protein
MMTSPSDTFDPITCPQLNRLVWHKRGMISREVAFKTYETYWRYLNYEAMAPFERELLVGLIDEFSDGAFKPYLDDLGRDRAEVIVELDPKCG